MKKFMIFLTLAVFAAMIGGCAGARLYTNIPAYGTVITVVNQTGYRLRVINDGRVVALLSPKPPNDFYPVVRRNFHYSAAQSSIIATAIDANGNPVGSALMPFSIDGNRRQSQSWVVTRGILQH